jgi:hypothetical protein
VVKESLITAKTKAENTAETSPNLAIFTTQFTSLTYLVKTMTETFPSSVEIQNFNNSSRYGLILHLFSHLLRPQLGL